MTLANFFPDFFQIFFLRYEFDQIPKESSNKDKLILRNPQFHLCHGSRIISTPLRDWSGKLAPFSKPIRFKTNIANWSLAFSHASPERYEFDQIPKESSNKDKLILRNPQFHLCHGSRIISTPLRDWSGKLAPFSKPIRFKTNIANWSLAFSHASPERYEFDQIPKESSNKDKLILRNPQFHLCHSYDKEFPTWILISVR